MVWGPGSDVYLLIYIGFKNLNCEAIRTPVA